MEQLNRLTKHAQKTARWVLRKYNVSALFWRNLAPIFYRLYFSKVGNGLIIEGSIRAWPRISGKVVAGQNLKLSSSHLPITIISYRNAMISIGNDVIIGGGCIITAAEGVQIGDSTIMGPYTIIIDSDGHGIDDAPTKTAPIKIGRHVWIGDRVTILKGVTIGDNSIIGAGSVITRDVERNTIVAGNPAKKIGSTKTGYNS